MSEEFVKFATYEAIERLEWEIASLREDMLHMKELLDFLLIGARDDNKLNYRVIQFINSEKEARLFFDKLVEWGMGLVPESSEGEQRKIAKGNILHAVEDSFQGEKRERLRRLFAWMREEEDG